VAVDAGGATQKKEEVIMVIRQTLVYGKWFKDQDRWDSGQRGSHRNGNGFTELGGRPDRETEMGKMFASKWGTSCTTSRCRGDWAPLQDMGVSRQGEVNGGGGTSLRKEET